MLFGEKVRATRIKAGLSQEELAKKIGVSLRTITNYEVQKRYPKKREMYSKLAEALNVDANYLMNEEDSFLAEASEKYGLRVEKQARELVSKVECLFAGGSLADEDLDEMMRGLQEAYWVAKEKNKKYAPKKYHKEGE